MTSDVVNAGPQGQQACSGPSLSLTPGLKEHRAGWEARGEAALVAQGGPSSGAGGNEHPALL